MILSDQYNTYKCLACGVKGDLIDYYAKTNGGVSIHKAADLINKEFNLGLEYKYEDDNDQAEMETRKSNLTDRHIKYLLSRGIERNSIVAYQMGAVGDNVSVPIYDMNDRLIFFLERSISGPYKGKSGPTRGVVGNLNKVRNKGGLIILTEGFFDCVQAGQENINAVCAFGSSFSISQLKLIKTYFRDFVLAMDNDEAGFKSNIELFINLKKIDPYLRITFADLGEHKDLGEYLMVNDRVQTIDLADLVIGGRLDIHEAVRILSECGLNLDKRINLLKIAGHYGMPVEELVSDANKK